MTATAKLYALPTPAQPSRARARGPARTTLALLEGVSEHFGVDVATQDLLLKQTAPILNAATILQAAARGLVAESAHAGDLARSGLTPAQLDV